MLSPAITACAADDTFFLTGTDEHGIKMVKTAADREHRAAGAGRSGRSTVFSDVWKEFDDHPRRLHPHDQRPPQIGGRRRSSRKLVANGDIYLGSYEGWYDEGQEEFVTETEAKANEYKSAVSGKPLVRYQEPTYFFRLKKYAPRVLEYIEQNPQFIQPDRAAQRSAQQAQSGRGGFVDQPRDAEVGHPAAARSRRMCFTSGSMR